MLEATEFREREMSAVINLRIIYLELKHGSPHIFLETSIVTRDGFLTITERVAFEIQVKNRKQTLTNFDEAVLSSMADNNVPSLKKLLETQKCSSFKSRRH